MPIKLVYLFSMFDRLSEKGFDIMLRHHAGAIIAGDLHEAIEVLEQSLLGLSIQASELVGSGGGESKITQRLKNALCKDHGWCKHIFSIQKIVDGDTVESTSHEIDHVWKSDKGTIALEIEWNNKDPFYDRDLENFKRLHQDGAISLGVIITRGSSLQDSMYTTFLSYAKLHGINNTTRAREVTRITKRQVDAIEKQASSGRQFEEVWASNLVADKYGKATTHWDKLQVRVDRGVGNPCPLLLIGIPASVVVNE